MTSGTEVPISVSSAAASTATNAARERVLVLDFGSQFAQLIARRAREQHVYCEIVRHDISPEQIKRHQPSGLILSGGPNSVYEPNAPRCHPGIFELGIPILGICYGMQLVCDQLGSRVTSSKAREYGRAHVQISKRDPFFDGVPDECEVWMSHGDQVQEISNGFISLARTATCPVAAVRHETLPVYGIQFHPEVTHTPFGKTLLKNFLFQICGCKGDWRLDDFANEAINGIRKRVGNDRVICGLSGGVDSSVVAALLYRAIGSQLSCILVDNGLLRKSEKGTVVEEFTKHFRTDLPIGR